ncbi:MAG: DUF2878 domain-containing protein [Phycisphaerae bacterium]|nr:DUF2878 domain-containing protein [Phycisphaerae bacterium]
MSRIAANLLGFQTAWWACVLSARSDRAWIGICIALVAFTVHLAVSPMRRVDWWFVPLAAGVGYAADNIATRFGALEFPVAESVMFPAPLWVGALWLAFATTLNTSFAWLKARPGLAAVVGAISGPLSYAAGSALGVVTLPSPAWSALVLAVAWGATLPGIMLIATRCVMHTRPSVVRHVKVAGGAP